MEPTIHIGGLAAKQVTGGATISFGKGFVNHRSVSKENGGIQIIGDSLVNGQIHDAEQHDPDVVDCSSWEANQNKEK